MMLCPRDARVPGGRGSLLCALCFAIFSVTHKDFLSTMQKSLPLRSVRSCWEETKNPKYTINSQC